MRPIDDAGYDESGVLRNKDLPWLYAGYRMSAFEEHMQPDLSEAEFVNEFLTLTEGADEIYVGLAPLESEGKRRGTHQIVAVISVALSDHRADPHVVWMPWATTKNKIEISCRFFCDMRRNYNVIVTSRFAERNMFVHICRTGILRHVGKIEGWFPDGETASLFHTKGLKDVQ